MMKTTERLMILIFDEGEVLDFCGPFEVFSVGEETAGTTAKQMEYPWNGRVAAWRARPRGGRHWGRKIEKGRK